MEKWETFIGNIIQHLGFSDWSIEVNEEERHGAVFIHDHPALIKANLPMIVESLNHVAQLVAHREGRPAVFFDVNNYRREREKLIAELAKAAARKVLATKNEIALPAMNAYERRLVHMELAMHPEVVTESCGVGRARYVVIKIISQETAASGAGQSPQGPEGTTH